MNAVINRITSMAERIAPSLRTSGANLGLAHAITTAIPALQRKRERYQNDCCASLANEDHVQEARVLFGTNCYRTVSRQSAVRQPQTVSSSKGGSVYSSQRLMHEFNGDIR